MKYAVDNAAIKIVLSKYPGDAWVFKIGNVGIYRFPPNEYHSSARFVYMENLLLNIDIIAYALVGYLALLNNQQADRWLQSWT